MEIHSRRAEQHYMQRDESFHHLPSMAYNRRKSPPPTPRPTDQCITAPNITPISVERSRTTKNWSMLNSKYVSILRSEKASISSVACSIKHTIAGNCNIKK